MKIIKFTKKRDGMYSLLLEDDDTILVHEDLILKYGLLMHKEIDDDLRDKIEGENLNYTAKTVALKYITTRFRSEKEVREHLNKKGVDKDIINIVVDSLKKDNYINDELFCEMFINDKITLTLEGPGKIVKELNDLGIHSNIISEKMIKYDEYIEKEKINKIIEKQIKSNHNKSNYILKNKIHSYLTSNGFSSSLSLECLNNTSFNNDKDLAKKEYEKLYKKYKDKYSDSELEYVIKQKMYQKGFGSFE